MTGSCEHDKGLAVFIKYWRFLAYLSMLSGAVNVLNTQSRKADKDGPPASCFARRANNPHRKKKFLKKCYKGLQAAFEEGLSSIKLAI
jgi:hypothetical protein